MKDASNLEMWAKHITGQEQRHGGGKAKICLPEGEEILRAVMGSKAERRKGDKTYGTIREQGCWVFEQALQAPPGLFLRTSQPAHLRLLDGWDFPHGLLSLLVNPSIGSNG